MRFRHETPAPREIHDELLPRSASLRFSMEALMPPVTEGSAVDATLVDGVVVLLSLSDDTLGLILCQLPHRDLVCAANSCRRLKDVLRMFASRLATREVLTLSHIGGAHCMAVADTGHVITGSAGSYGDSHVIRVYRGDELVRTIRTRDILTVASLPGGARFIIGACDKTVKLFTIGGKLKRTFKVDTVVPRVAVLPDGVHFVVGAGYGEFWLVRFDGTLVHAFKGFNGFVEALAVTRDGRHIISSSTDKLVKVWSVASKRLLSTCTGHGGYRTNHVVAVAAMPDSQRVLSGGFDKTVRVWLLNGTLENTFELHTGAVNALVALPDNKHALSGAIDGTITLFNVNDGAVLRLFTHHTCTVAFLVLLPDGLRFVSCSIDGTFRVAYHGLCVK